ncbi:MAG: hypothetical protein GF390_00110 [Candidatus Pacebacteria bacterium]|nr:hypothetical protein [Candidatus Paceibacterota bacterium]
MSGSRPAAGWRERGPRLRFEGNTCHACGRIMFPPREICLECEAGGLGVVVLPELFTSAPQVVSGLTFSPNGGQQEKS